jgi:hypothetical protein
MAWLWPLSILGALTVGVNLGIAVMALLGGRDTN